MKKRSFSRKIRSAANLLVVLLIVSQSASLILLQKKVIASTEPHGALSRVIVTYRGQAATGPDAESAKSQAQELSNREAWLAGSLDYQAGYKKVSKSYSQLPIVTMDVDAEGMASLKANPNVVSVTEDKAMKSDAIGFQYTPVVMGGTAATGFSDGTNPFTGASTAVVVLDTGVDKAHEALTGAVVSEACYGIDDNTADRYTVESACPGASLSTTAAGSGAPCPTSCDHGTEVASTIALSAGTYTSGPDSFDASGVAKGAKIVAIQVNAKVTEKAGQLDTCGDAGNDTETCYLPFMSLILAGMNRALELQNNNTLGIPVVAVNNSNGIPTYAYTTACDSIDTGTGLNTAAAALKAKNIAMFNSAGNEGASALSYDKVSYPACLSNFIAVSASSATDKMSYYSNAGALTTIVAPGGNQTGDASNDGGIFVAKPSDTYGAVQGTSFASPIAAAAFAVVREKVPDASVDGIIAGFKSTGVSIAEDRSGYSAHTYERINLGAALAAADTFPKYSAQAETPSTTPGETPTTDWVPGVPSAGQANYRRSVSIIGLGIVFLIFINRSAFLKRKHAR